MACRLIGYGHWWLTSVLKMTQPISKISWTRHTKAITDATVSVGNNSLKKAALEVKKYLLRNTSFWLKDDLLEATKLSASVGTPEESRVSRHFFRKNWEQLIDIILKTTYFRLCSNIKAPPPPVHSTSHSPLPPPPKKKCWEH